MNNVANYVDAGRLLMERYQTLYWTPCVSHCIDLMLEHGKNFLDQRNR
jgi:hypothetical protein